MTYLRVFNGDGGTNLSAVTTSDTGSGDAPTALIKDTGGTVTYTPTNAAHGGMAVLCATTATAKAAMEAAGLGAVADIWQRAYCFKTVAPGVNQVLMAFRQPGNNSISADIRWNTADKIEIRDSLGNVASGGTSTTTLPHNAQVRIAFHVQHSTGTVTVKIYKTDPEAAISSPDETLQVTGLSVGASTDVARVGNVGQNNSGNTVIDDWVIATTTEPGPFVNGETSGGGGTPIDPGTTTADLLVRYNDTWIPVSSGAGTGTGGTGATGPAGPPGGAVSIGYTFSTTTTDSDPGSGILRLSNATQSSSTVVRADLLDSTGTDWSTILDTFDDSTNTVKGLLRLYKNIDLTKWLLFDVTAVASPSGYRNISVTNIGPTGQSPFANGDAVTLAFTPAGDQGAQGVGSSIPNGPLADYDPAVNGFKAANYNPRYASNVSNATTQRIYLVKVRALYAAASGARTAKFFRGAAGTSLTAGQSLMAVFDSTGVQLGTTSADQATNWASSSGLMSVSVGSFALTAGADYYVALMSNGTGTQITIGRIGSGGVQNFGLSGASLFTGHITGDAQTTMPASFTPSALTADGLDIWAAIA